MTKTGRTVFVAGMAKCQVTTTTTTKTTTDHKPMTMKMATATTMTVNHHVSSNNCDDSKGNNSHNVD